MKKILKHFKKSPHKNLFKNISKKQTSLKKRNLFNFRFLQNFYFLSRKNIFLTLLILVLSFLGFSFFGPIFKLESIKVFRKDDLINMDVSYKSLEDFRGKLIFNLDKNEISKKIKLYQENIEHVDINIVFPKTLKINLQSYEEIFNIKIGEKSFLLVKNGALVPYKFKDNLRELKVFSLLEHSNFLEYKKIFLKKDLDKISEIIKTLEQNIFSLKVSGIFYFETEKELHLKVNDYTYLIFSLDGNIDKQLKNLIILNKEHKKISKKDLVYIDLRVENKIFYCLKEKEKICLQNLESIYPDYKKFKNK